LSFGVSRLRVVCGVVARVLRRRALRLLLPTAVGAGILLAPFSGGASAAGSCSTSSPYASAVSGTSGLISYWRLDDSTGTSACDAKGTNVGTYSGGFTLGQAGALAGDSDNASSFNGSTGKVSIPSATSLNVADTFTIEAWVKRGSVGGTASQVIASKGANAWMLLFNSSNKLVLQQSGSTAVNTSTTAVADTTSWHHVVATKSGTTVHLYIDGKDASGTTSNKTMANNTQPLVIGQDGTSSPFNGTIDDVALYSSALNANQVSNHYLLGSAACPTGSSPYAQSITGVTGLLGYWRFGESSGTTACDTVGKDPGSYQGGFTLAQSGATNSDSDTAVKLNGTTGWVSVPLLSSLDTGDTFTIEGWVKRGTVGGTASQVIASKQGSSWTLSFNTANKLVLQGGSTTITTSSGAVSDTTAWHHVAATKAGSSVHLYIDGQDVTGTVTNATLANSSSPLAIGQTGAGGSWFNGSLDDIALYNSALTASQIAAHYQAGASPGNSSPPTISGTTKDGQTLTAANGSWRGASSFSYRWQACDSGGSNCSDISGATGSTYNLAHGDVGKTIRVVVTATNSVGSTPANSSVTAAIQAVAPANTAAPTISGSATEGQTLTASNGSWSGTPGSYGYRWQTCDSSGTTCNDITGATSQTYTLAHGDVGKRIRVVVTSTNSAGSASANATATAAVAGIPPNNTSAPTISGTAADGQTLTASPGSWDGSPTFTYQWRSCDSAGANCTDIQGATSQTYTAGASDIASTLRVVVTGTNSAGTATATSDHTATVTAIPPSNSSLPTISGTAASGQTLTANRGTWAGSSPTYGYQWRRCDSAGASCADISGATSQTYVLGSSDVATTLRVVVTATNAAGSASATSSQTRYVTAPQPDVYCTDMWSGAGGDGYWDTPSNWSTGNVPTASDHACIPNGASVNLRDGNDQVGSVNAQGSLTIQNGHLELTDTTLDSTVNDFTMTYWASTLSGAGNLDVTGSFEWDGGTMTGTGITDLAQNVQTAVNSGSQNPIGLDGRTLRNHGTFNFVFGWMDTHHSALFDNSGTTNLYGEAGITWSWGDNPAPILRNTGLLQKASGDSSIVQPAIDNQGTIVSQSGKLSFDGGSPPNTSSTGSWSATAQGSSISLGSGNSGYPFAWAPGVNLSGSIAEAGATINAQDIQGSAADLSISSGTLNVSGTASTVRTLSQSAGTLAGAGTITASDSLSWTGGSMSGSGITELGSGAHSTINSGQNTVGLDTRTLRNHGTLDMTSGGLDARHGALVDNSGTINLDSDAGFGWSWGCCGDSPPPLLRNTGTLQKTAGTGSSPVQLAIDNQGSVTAQSGRITFDGGSIPNSNGSGSWSATGQGTSLAFTGGNNGYHFNWGPGVNLAGSINVGGATIDAQDVQGPTADLSITSGTLNLNGAPSQARGLSITAGYLSGSGELNVSDSLGWTGGVMSGTGATVLGPGLTGTINPGGGNSVLLDTRTLQNHGALTQTSGAIAMKNGALIDNSGTVDLNGEGGQCCSGPTGGVSWSTGPFDTSPMPRFVNTGTVEKTAGTGFTSIEPAFDNPGRVISQTGQLDFNGGSVAGSASSGSWSSTGTASVSISDGPHIANPFVWGAGVSLSGTVVFGGGNTYAQDIQGPAATASIIAGHLHLSGPAPSNLSRLQLTNGNGGLDTTSTLNVSDSLSWTGGTMSGSGATVLGSGAESTIDPGGGGGVLLDGHILRNRGVLTQPTGVIAARNGALLDNSGTYNMNADGGGATRVSGDQSAIPVLYNTGTVQKTAGTGTTTIEWARNNPGTIVALTGTFALTGPDITPSKDANANGVAGSDELGGGDESSPAEPACAGDPVNCATGNLYENETDLAAGGRGLGLDLTRTYNSQVAATQASSGAFGYGWSSSYSDHLKIDTNQGTATVVAANGSTNVFTATPSGPYIAPSWVHSVLVHNSDGSYTYTLPSQRTLSFDQNGRLQSESDRNGNSTSLSYDGSGHLATITDPVGRAITLTYNGDGTVATATDPGGLTMSYAYTNGNLASVSASGVAAARWQFGYDSAHQMTSITDGRGKTTATTYDPSHRVTSQTDPLNRTRTWDYPAAGETRITNPAGDVTRELFDHNQLTQITRAYGTSDAESSQLTYDSARNLKTVTDANNHTTSFGYDADGNRTSVTDANNHTTQLGYDSTHDVSSITPPTGSAMSIGRDQYGNPTTLTRSHDTGNGTITQTTTLGYNSHGELASLTTPLDKTWTFTSNSQGDTTTATSPDNETTSWGYDADSRLTSTTTPGQHTTTITRDGLGRPTVIHDPLGHDTTLGYDGDDNLTDITDALSKHTQLAYDDASQLTSVTAADATSQQYGYDPDGRETSYTDANNHPTSYHRDTLGRVTSVTDPLSRTTRYGYDGAGNVTSKTDALNHTTSYSYDPANQLTGIDYSDPGTHDVSLGYDPAGRRTSMTDATGASSYSYDDLGRLTSMTDGANNKTSYAYDLADQQTAITYPNNGTVSRAYDASGRIQSITDWLGKTTTFGYDPDSNLTTTTFPAETGDIDHYDYDAADNMSAVTMTHGGQTLASIAYTRDADGQLTSSTPTGLPGGAESYSYDQQNRLTQAGSSSFSYDPAGNQTNGGQNSFDNADELTSTPAANYDYNADGQRTKSTPTTGGATTYGYDQAGDLQSAQHGTDPADNYSYDGDGLRTSKTQGGTNAPYSWDRSNAQPQLLADGSHAYIYDPDGTPLEQIDSSNHAETYHHDQLGSTRLLTDTTGQATGTYTYDAYGVSVGSTGTATTPLGYAGQYTDSDTGLQYLRARDYDPQSAQFTSRDPIEAQTNQPYSYADTDPINEYDPTGLIGVPHFLKKAFNKVEGPGGLVDRVVPDSVSNFSAGILDGLSGGRASKLAGVAQDCWGAAHALGDKLGPYLPVLGTLRREEAAAEALAEVRKDPANLAEQLALGEAQGGAGSRIMEGKIGDPAYPENQWAKMQHVHQNPDGTNTVIHYWENLESGETHGFKFIDP
jgi:RHS repeat-associated protein